MKELQSYPTTIDKSRVFVALVNGEGSEAVKKFE